MVPEDNINTNQAKSWDREQYMIVPHDGQNSDPNFRISLADRWPISIQT